MTGTTDIVACPVCGTEVSLTDTHCPKCNAEFAPGVMDEPLESAIAARRKERKNSRSVLSGTGSLPSMQIILLSLTYAVGYGSIIAANYISSGGIVNQGYEQIMLLVGAITLAAAVVSAFLIGRFGSIQSGRISFALIATFVLLIPPLVFMFSW